MITPHHDQPPVSITFLQLFLLLGISDAQHQNERKVSVINSKFPWRAQIISIYFPSHHPETKELERKGRQHKGLVSQVATA